MPIPLNCTCGRAFQIKDELAGRKIRCPECKSILTVPAAQKEADLDDLVMEVLAADEPDDAPMGRSLRRGAIQAEIPEVLPVRQRPRDDDEAISVVRRRKDDDPPIKKRRPKLRREESRRGPAVAFEPGWFGSVNSGVVGGLLMILIAVVWFIGGLAAGYIFFYPPILLVIGLIAIAKGLTGGD